MYEISANNEIRCEKLLVNPSCIYYVSFCTLFHHNDLEICLNFRKNFSERYNHLWGCNSNIPPNRFSRYIFLRFCQVFYQSIYSQRIILTKALRGCFYVPLPTFKTNNFHWSLTNKQCTGAAISCKFFGIETVSCFARDIKCRSIMPFFIGWC